MCDYRLGAKVMSRVTTQGLDAGGVYTVEGVRHQCVFHPS